MIRVEQTLFSNKLNTIKRILSVSFIIDFFMLIQKVTIYKLKKAPDKKAF